MARLAGWNRTVSIGVWGLLREGGRRDWGLKSMAWVGWGDAVVVRSVVAAVVVARSMPRWSASRRDGFVVVGDDFLILSYVAWL